MKKSEEKKKKNWFERHAGELVIGAFCGLELLYINKQSRKRGQLEGKIMNLEDENWSLRRENRNLHFIIGKLHREKTYEQFVKKN